jgi:hypothetical protein
MKAAHLAMTMTLILAGAGVTWAQTERPSAALPAALRGHLRTEQFAPVVKVGDLPEDVRGALKELFGGRGLELAEPGAPFQKTDVLVLPRLPSRRLIHAGCSADHCLVYYERGGFDHVHHIALVRFDGTSARLEGGGLASAGLRDLDQVKNALLSGKILGGSKYW